MSKLDKAKEYIGMLKVYMGILIALIISDVSGTAKLFNAETIDVTFWFGVISIVVLSVLFMILAKHTHKKINELEEL